MRQDDGRSRKACRLVRDAAGLGARLVLFPEAFVPAYPRGLHFGAPVMESGITLIENGRFYYRVEYYGR